MNLLDKAISAVAPRVALQRARSRVALEPVVYQSAQAGMAVGDPVTITAIRHLRERAESGGVAKVEEISINPADLPNFPQPGDWVTAWGLQFVVGPVRQPDPYGMVLLSLTLRAGQILNS